MFISKQSHVDHNLSGEVIAFILEQFGDREAFFIETVEIPDEIPSLSCGLYGPIMGDPEIIDDHLCYTVFYEQRGDRAGKSRMIDLPAQKSRLLTVIGGPDDDGVCVLYTAFGGPAAPREPWDESLSDDERAESEAFWSVHALAAR